MAEKIKLWCGFSTMVYWKLIDGKGATITLTSRGQPRENPDDAWEDALKHEQENELHVRTEKARASTIRTGICPPHFIV